MIILTYDPNTDIRYITYRNLTNTEDLKVQQEFNIEYVEWFYVVLGEHIRVIREFYEIFDNYKYLYRLYIYIYY